MMKFFGKALAITGIGFLALSMNAQAGETPSPSGAKSYIVNLKDGDVVTGPVKVIFGLSGMGIAPASIDRPNTGHHHLFVNRAPFGETDELGSEEANLPIPNTEKTRHFGGGQTETVLDLPPGEHTLQLVLADYIHVAHNPPVISERITITVK